MNNASSKALVGVALPASILLLLYTGYTNLIMPSVTAARLSPPSLQHWFGTDVMGGDLFLASLQALGLEVGTLLVVLPVIYFSGLLIGMGLSYFSNDKIREFLLNFIHYWVTLPVILIALFLLILIGAGQKNAIVVMIFVLVPTLALYVYNQLETAKKNDFFIAKLSYGFSRPYIYRNHLLPVIAKGFTDYSLARMPEIIMMNLALNFLGLGAQPPVSSFGRMLFDGLSFMFSAWWMWLFSSLLVISLYTILISVWRSVANGGN